MSKVFVIEVVSEAEDALDPCSIPIETGIYKVEPGEELEMVWELKLVADPEAKTIMVYRDDELVLQVDAGEKVEYTSKRTLTGSFQQNAVSGVCE